jgi:hypothetical protein
LVVADHYGGCVRCSRSHLSRVPRTYCFLPRFYILILVTFDWYFNWHSCRHCYYHVTACLPWILQLLLLSPRSPNLIWW